MFGELGSLAIQDKADSTRPILFKYIAISHAIAMSITAFAIIASCATSICQAGVGVARAKVPRGGRRTAYVSRGGGGSSGGRDGW